MKPCPKPKRRKKTERQALEAELEKLIREIVWWRDGGKCIEADVDGIRCGGSIQWGHFTPRGQSKWLKFTLATFCQCRNHNALHDKGSQTMALAVGKLLGLDWIERHEANRDSHRGCKIHEYDLQERLEEYRLLWEMRPSLHDTKTLIEGGYYD